MAVGAADQEGEIGRAAIEVKFQKIGKAGAVHCFAALIERDREGLGGEGRNQAPGLFRQPLGHIIATRFGDLADGETGDAARAAGGFGPPGIVLDELFLGPGLEPPDRYDVKLEAQIATRSSGACSDHSFSRL
jgi:hypothetical protein